MRQGCAVFGSNVTGAVHARKLAHTKVILLSYTHFYVFCDYKVDSL